MPPADRLLAFVLTATVVIAIPGPSVLFVIGQALARGRGAAIRSVAGNTAGEYVQVIAVAVGIGALAQRSIAALTALKLLGGAYLVYLGVRTIRQRRVLAAPLADGSAAPGAPARPFTHGFVVGVTNPKTIVFLAAILPQFASRSAGGLGPQILVLGLIFGAVALVSDTAWALAAGRFRAWLAASPRRLELVGGAGGAAIVAVGAGLLLSARRS